MLRVLAVSCLLVVAGCVDLGIVETASIMATKKTMGDHAVSIYSGKNCSTVRTEKGLPYCEEDEVEAISDVYCYRTLGNVTCYDRPAPHNGRQQRIGVDTHNLVKAR